MKKGFNRRSTGGIAVIMIAFVLTILFSVGYAFYSNSKTGDSNVSESGMSSSGGGIQNEVGRSGSAEGEAVCRIGFEAIDSDSDEEALFAAAQKRIDENRESEVYVPRLYKDRDEGSQGPFTNDLMPTIAWGAVEEMPFRLELATDENMDTLFFRAIGTGTSVEIPAGVMASGRRYFMRLSTVSEKGEWSEWTEPDWFVVDERYLGMDAVSAHHFPFGKIANHNLVREVSNRLHLVFGALIRDRREIVYAFSDDDGESWTMKRLPRLNKSLKVINPSLALDEKRGLLHIAWGEYRRFPGNLVHSIVDISGEPYVKRQAEIVSTEETKYCLCTMSTMAIDSEGTVHAVWQIGRNPCTCEIAYANNRNGWGEASILHSVHGNGVGPNLCIDASDRIHVMWEGGQYRWSEDGGGSWKPSLNDAPLQMFADLETENLRPRFCAMASFPGSDRIIAMTAAEDIIRNEKNEPEWASNLNVHSLWMRDVVDGVPQARRLVYSINDARIVTLEESKKNHVGVHFMLFPSVSTSASGEIAVVWQEMKVKSTGKCIRSAGRIYDPSEGWGETFEIGGRPESGTVAPFLTPHFEERIDMVWTESGHYDWRSILGADMDENFDLYNVYHGVFFSVLDKQGNDLRRGSSEIPMGEYLADWKSMRENCLSSGGIYASTAAGYEYSWFEDDLIIFEPDKRDGIPDMITIPKAVPSAIAPTEPTNTPTRTPTHTPSPTPTVTPEGTAVQVISVGDAYVDSLYDNINYGEETYMSVYNRYARYKESFVRFPVSLSGANIEIVDAKVGLYLQRSYGCSVRPFLVQEDWNELSINWNVKPSITAIDSPSVEAGSAGSWIHLDVVDAVEAWVNDGEPNYGICIKQTDSVMGTTEFRSREAFGESTRPRLWIYYKFTDGTPTPDITATPGPSTTPEPTQNPKVTVEIETNKALYQANDLMTVTLNLANNKDFVFPLRLYIILDVYGVYYYYPDWTTQEEGFDITLWGNQLYEDDILNLTLPDPLAAGGPFTFWAGGLYRADLTLATNIDSASFAFI